MRHPAFLLLLAVAGMLATSLLIAQHRGSMLSETPGPLARLVVVVDGDTSNWANWGFLWDAGERRNGRVFTPASGILDGNARASELDESNKRIYLAITDSAWDAAIGPTETEILHAIARKGYRLVEIDDDLAYPDFAHFLEKDKLPYAKTYWFERNRWK